MRLLVLDDEPGIRSLISRVALDLGWQVETAADLDGFRAQCAGVMPDAVMLDLNLGHGDLNDSLKLLAATQFAGSIILMSGSDRSALVDAKDLSLSLGLNVAATTEKPIRLAELRRLLGLLGRPQDPTPAK
jgi:two-component system chemotaxis response regulator CheY